MSLKLIREFIDTPNLDIISEGTSDSKTYKIRGPFLQANIKNGNGRVYPKHLIESEVVRYTREKIQRKNAFGELDHPPTPTINMDRVSHIIESLEMKDNLAIGVAKILPTTMGKLVEVFLDAGTQLGVSSRGVGSINGNVVGPDYKLLAVDIVADPSAPAAMVEGILESVDWKMYSDGQYHKVSENVKNEVIKPHADKVELINAFINHIKYSI